MAWQSGGGGGYPGVTSPTAGDLAIQHNLTTGDRNAPLAADTLAVYGSIILGDADGNNVDGDTIFVLSQFKAVPLGGFGPDALNVSRQGVITAQDYSRPMVNLIDTTLSAQPVLHVEKHGTTVLEIGAIKSITGALSTVSDAPAKAVLTSIIATLTGIKVATNNTT